MNDFPVCLQLEGRPVLVVGAGTVASRRISSLVRAGARVRVVAPQATAEVARLAEEGALRWDARSFEPADLEGARVAFAATDDRAANRGVAEEAARRGVLVNAADDPAACDFTMPAVARHGEMTVAVSSGGTNPGYAGKVRDWIAALLQSPRPRGAVPRRRPEADRLEERHG